MRSASVAVGGPGVAVVEPHPDVERPRVTVGPYGFRLVGSTMGGTYRVGFTRGKPGVAHIHHLTRSLPERRREYLARLARMRQMYGWRVNVARWMAAWDMWERNRDMVKQVQTFQHAERSEALLVFQGSQIGIDDVSAMIDAANDAQDAVTAPNATLAWAERSARAMLTIFYLLVRCHRVDSISAADNGPPGDDPPPQVADVLALVSAPRPGPLCGVPVAA